MKIKKIFFKNSSILPVDNFFKNVLYDKKYGYYSTQFPFGGRGDFITSPKISNLFSEIIAIWIISCWESFGKPKNFNIVELGPGDGSLTNILLRSFEKFPEFNSIKNLFLYEESEFLRKIQKKKIHGDVKWINDFNKIKKGPIIFFGNEFFDSIPIKQFKIMKKSLFEKNYILDKNHKIKQVYKKASISNLKLIKSYKTLKKLKFIEFPKLGFQELEKIVKKISKLKGCILLIDYGYLKPNNQNTLQSVMKHKKNNLKIKKSISQKKFLENMGIIERAKILSKKMKFTEQSDLYLRLKRLLGPRYMGELFKVILAYKFDNNNFLGFK